MVQVDGGDDADLPALLGMELFGDGLVGDGAGLVGVDHAGVGLVAGGDGGGGGGGVRGEAAGVIGDGGACHGKVHEVQRHGSVQLGTLTVLDAGLSLHVVGVSHGAQIVGSGLELGIAHAVADEQEHILGCSVLGQGTGQDAQEHDGSQRDCQNSFQYHVFFLTF